MNTTEEVALNIPDSKSNLWLWFQIVIIALVGVGLLITALNFIPTNVKNSDAKGITPQDWGWCTPVTYPVPVHDTGLQYVEVQLSHPLDPPVSAILSPNIGLRPWKGSEVLVVSFTNKGPNGHLSTIYVATRIREKAETD